MSSAGLLRGGAIACLGAGVGAGVDHHRQGVTFRPNPLATTSFENRSLRQ